MLRSPGAARTTVEIAEPFAAPDARMHEPSRLELDVLEEERS
jgi:hypothetical protein